MENFYEYIDRYVSKELSAEELKAFEEALKTDEALQKEVQLQQNIVGLLESQAKAKEGEASFKDLLSTIEAKHYPKTSNKTPSFFLRNRYIIGSGLAIAASLLVLLWIRVVPSLPSIPNPPVATFTEMSSEATALQQAGAAFNNKDFSVALNFFEQYLETSTNDYEARYYQGISHFELEQLDKAEEVFLAIQEEDNDYQYEAVFYRAMIRFKQGNLEETKALLQQIPERADNFEQAETFLKQL